MFHSANTIAISLHFSVYCQRPNKCFSNPNWIHLINYILEVCAIYLRLNWKITAMKLYVVEQFWAKVGKMAICLEMC